MKIIVRADVLREAAARQNKTLREVAVQVGIDLRYLHRLIQGRHEPTASMRRRLCDALGLKFGRLFEIRQTNGARK